ncbi:outer membrane protein assembly factor BamB family protein [Streptomyces sp. NPDC002644]
MSGRERGGNGQPWGQPLVMTVVGGAMIALAVEFHWLGWTSIPGNSCGSSYRPCPEGTTPTLILAFALTFVGALWCAGAVGTLTAARPGKGLPAVALALGALLAVWPGWLAHSWLRGPILEVAWDTPRDRPASVTGQGVWPVGPAGDPRTVVRARDDALVAYDVRGGAERWDLAAPTRGSVCGMSPAPVDGVGLVGFARHERPCDTVWAVDVRTGEKLWERKITGVPGFTTALDGQLAADGTTAVSIADGTVLAYGLRDGKPLWKRELEEDCQPLLTSAAESEVQVLVQCGDTAGEFRSLDLLSLDAASGDTRRTRALPVESEAGYYCTVSADPFVLALKEEDDRGLHAALIFEGEGDPVTLPMSSRDGDLRFTGDGDGFPSVPAYTAAVTGDRLVVVTGDEANAEYTKVSAYRLDDGRRLWSTDTGAPVRALAPAGEGHVAVLGDDARLRLLALSDGAKDDEDGASLHDGAADRIAGTPLLVPVGDDYVVVNDNGTENTPLLGLRQG